MSRISPAKKRFGTSFERIVFGSTSLSAMPPEVTIAQLNPSNPSGITGKSFM